MKKNHSILNVIMERENVSMGKVYFLLTPKRVQKTRDKKTGEFSFVELDDYVEPGWRVQHEGNAQHEWVCWYVCQSHG